MNSFKLKLPKKIIKKKIYALSIWIPGNCKALFFQAVFRTKLSFRPHSTESFTHQKMTRSMADRTNKATGIKVISQVGRDPEANRCVLNIK